MAPASSVLSLPTPAAIADIKIMRSNADKMLSRAASLDVTLRPHVKTHKTLQGALLQTGGRRSTITCSTLAEAEFFQSQGFTDILYAVPVDPSKTLRCAALARTGCDFHVLVDNVAQLHPLIKHGRPLPELPWSIAVMVDSGYGRDGVEPSSDEALSLVTLVRSSPELKLRILYTHGGHSYDVPPGSIPDIQRVAAQERDSIVALAKRVPGGVEGVITGVGSTPTCSHPPADGLEGISEMHPGNYLLYDVTQMLIGSCTREQIAMRVLTRVVGHYPSRNTIQIDCGWTGCSQQGKENGFGEIEKYGSSASSSLVITNLKQEAGSVTTIDGSPLNFADYPLGTLMAILPWHSCAASHQHRRIYVTDGGDDIVDTWATVDGW